MTLLKKIMYLNVDKGMENLIANGNRSICET